MPRGNYTSRQNVVSELKDLTGLSVRERKILLLMLRVDENTVPLTSHLRESDNLMQILEPPTKYTTTIASPWSRPGKIVPHLNEGNWNRTFLGLHRKGLIDCEKVQGRGRLKYWLTPEGVERARILRAEVKAYIDEWAPLFTRVNYTST